MSNRITRTQADNLAEIVGRRMHLDGTELCSSCKRSDRGESTYYNGCALTISGAYGGYSVRIRHANTGESDLSGGYGPLREAYTFLRGMYAALREREA